jgi:N,N'-diacetyllegionaminate synthase
LTGFDIGSRHIGDGSPCLIVAEVGQAHEGSLGQAHAFLDAAADAGADAIKYQLHLPALECAPDEPWRVAPAWPQDASRYDYWKRTSLSDEQLWSLAAHAEQRGVIFLCSPFSVEGVRLLERIVPAWKVASGEVANVPLLSAMATTGKPAILSTGMSTWDEIASARARFERCAVLQCTSEYPTPAERVGLGTLDELRRRFACPVGLSDHSGTIYAGLGAVALGADVLEVHVTWSRQAFGFDVPASLTFTDLRMLVDGARFIERAKCNVDKDVTAELMAPMRHLFMGKSRRKAEHDARA